MDHRSYRLRAQRANVRAVRAPMHSIAQLGQCHNTTIFQQPSTTVMPKSNRTTISWLVCALLAVQGDNALKQPPGSLATVSRI